MICWSWKLGSSWPWFTSWASSSGPSRTKRPRDRVPARTVKFVDHNWKIHNFHGKSWKNMEPRSAKYIQMWPKHIDIIRYYQNIKYSIKYNETLQSFDKSDSNLSGFTWFIPWGCPAYPCRLPPTTCHIEMCRGWEAQTHHCGTSGPKHPSPLGMIYKSLWINRVPNNKVNKAGKKAMKWCYGGFYYLHSCSANVLVTASGMIIHDNTHILVLNGSAASVLRRTLTSQTADSVAISNNHIAHIQQDQQLEE